MADVWKIGQDISAADYYEQNQRISANSRIKSEILGAEALADICNEMSKTYDDIIADQNDYVFNIEDKLGDIENLQAALEEEIKKLEAERDELLQKGNNGPLSEEDKKRLEEINAEINELTCNTQNDINNINQDMQNSQKTRDLHLTKAEIARDYGETACEKGEKLANREDKRKSFWRKLFSSWNNAAYREAGQKALEAGNNLLDQVDYSESLNEDIEKKLTLH